jgi:hypothetical protein
MKLGYIIQLGSILITQQIKRKQVNICDSITIKRISMTFEWVTFNLCLLFSLNEVQLEKTQFWKKLWLGRMV